MSEQQNPDEQEKQLQADKEAHKHIASDKDVKEGERPRNYDEAVIVVDEEAHEVVRQAQPRGLAGTVIAVAQLTMEILTQVLNALASVNRKIAVGVGFQVNAGAWDEPSVYFFSGTMDDIIPYSVADGKAPLIGFRKTAGPVATGTVGVFAYYNRNLHRTLMVMWSVPFDYNLYSNWWNVEVVSGKHTANNSWYNDLYYGRNGRPYPFRGDDNWKNTSFGNIKIRGAMNSSGTPRLQINLFL